MTHHYQNSLVRDLAWACFDMLLVNIGELSNHTVANCGLQHNPARREWLLELDENPAPLINHMDDMGSHRLGIYFERLWHFFLEHDPNVDLIAHNLPIVSKGRTIGEFDCIYYCHKRSSHIHLELAVKFFLAASSHKNASCQENPTQPSGLNRWWGPECQDRLDLKLRHLLDRQIRLSEHSASRLTLAKMGIESLDKEIEVKGYLFQSATNPIALPIAYGSDRIDNKWVHLENLRPFCQGLNANAFKHLPKFQWLSPAVELDASNTLDAVGLEASMHQHFASETRPQLVANLDRDGKELCRFFVAGNDWPQGNGERKS